MRSKLSAIALVVGLVVNVAVLAQEQKPAGAAAPPSYSLWEFGTMPRPAFKQVLMGVAAVQEELKLTEAQKKAIAKTSQGERERIRKARRENADRQKFLAAREELMKAMLAAILANLEPKQRERLDQIQLQSQGPLAFNRPSRPALASEGPDLVERLKLTEDQIKKVRAIAEEGDGDITKAAEVPIALDTKNGAPTPDSIKKLVETPEFKAAKQKTREAARKAWDSVIERIERVLTESQRTAYHEMLGAPFDLHKIRFSNDEAAEDADNVASALNVRGGGGGGGGQESDPTFDTKVARPSYTTEHPRVLFDQAHNNFHTTDGRYKPFAEIMANDGFKVMPNKEKFTKDLLAKGDILVIANALGAEGGGEDAASNSAFTEAECDAVRDWVQEGGSLLLITDHAPFGSAAESLAKRFGVDMGKVCTSDPSNSEGGEACLVFTHKNNLLGDHAITKGRDDSEKINRIQTFAGQSLKGPPGSVAILKLGDTAVDEGDDDKPKSAAGRAQGIAFPFGKGRVVVMGEAAELSAQLIGNERYGMNVPGLDNRQMALNIMHWLSGLLEPRDKALRPLGQNAASDSHAIAGFRLQDFRGASFALDDVREKKLVVLAFLGVECPLANQYAPRLVELARSFEPKGVAFFAIDANQQDGATAMGRFASANGLSFPFLKDVGNALADTLEVARTPEVIVLDAKRHIRYRGRIDDQFALGVHRTGTTRNDLAVALDELLAGKDVSVAKTEPVGCRVGRIRRPGSGEVTYTKQVARILSTRCVTCHRPGEIAPFSLTNYKEAAGWAETIAEVVGAGRMPPWHANREYGKFQNDAHLSDDEKQLIAAWVANGAPEGDKRDLPPLPPQTEGGWRIPKPDLIVELPRTVQVPAGGVLPYQYFVLDPKLDHDVWVRASQVRPGNPTVLHHLVVFVLPPGRRDINPVDADFLAGYSPGMPPREAPPGLAKVIEAGSKLLVQAHYTPRGRPQTDRSKIGLVFADPATIRKRLTSAAAINAEFRIPPNAASFQAVAQHRFNQDYILYALMPHMHLRGKSFRFEATYPDGQSEVLLDVPHYEFDWQNAYILDVPKPMPEGTVMRCVGVFDNSADNPNNPDPARTVRFGEQTNDEMLIGYMNVALDYQDLSVGPPKVVKRGDGQFDVTFRHRPPEGTNTVHLAASFNKDYSPVQELAGPDREGFFMATVVVPAGKYKYKYVHDGNKYRHDPANWRQTGFFNDSVLTVSK